LGVLRLVVATAEPGATGTDRSPRRHDIRHTSDRLIHKSADQQLAKPHLAHVAGITADPSLKERLDELAKLKEPLFEPWRDGAQSSPASPLVTNSAAALTTLRNSRTITSLGRVPCAQTSTTAAGDMAAP
jgi:hypothetical protein